MTSSLTDNGSRATMASLRCRLAPPMLTGGLLLPCHDVYICSEGNFQSKKAQNFNRLEGKDKEMAANDSCYKSSGSSAFLKSQFWAVSARVKPAGCRRPSGRRGRVLRLRRPSVNTHPSSNQKPEFPSGSPGEPTADGGGSEQFGPLSRNLQRRQRRLQPGCV